jgi:hypothetical protein
MKKIIITLITIIIFLIILLTLINKNNEEEIKYEYNNTYYKTTNTYINDELYSIRNETIILEDGFLNYESNIKYTDTNIEPIKLEYIDTYIEKKDRIITTDKTYYLDSKKICLESIDCDSPYTTNNNNEVISLNDFKLSNYVKTKKEIYLSNNEIDIYVILDKSNASKEFKKVINQVAYDLNITINIIDLNNKLKQELSNKNNIKEYPVTLVYFNNELISTNIGNKSHKELVLILFLLGIDYR